MRWVNCKMSRAWELQRKVGSTWLRQMGCLVSRGFQREPLKDIVPYIYIYIFVLIITVENLYFIQASESIKAHLFDHIRSRHIQEDKTSNIGLNSFHHIRSRLIQEDNIGLNAYTIAINLIIISRPKHDTPPYLVEVLMDGRTVELLIGTPSSAR